jgi:hypothetical protein
MRRPGEPVEEFAERAESEAWLADTPKPDAEITADPIIQQADAEITPEHGDARQDEAATQLQNDANTPERHAYARAFSVAAAADTRELRGRDPRPEPDRTPSTPHPDPFLTGRGWHVNAHGIYSRTPEPQPSPMPDKDLEAGLWRTR